LLGVLQHPDHPAKNKINKTHISKLLKEKDHQFAVQQKFSAEDFCSRQGTTADSQAFWNGLLSRIFLCEQMSHLTPVGWVI